MINSFWTYSTGLMPTLRFHHAQIQGEARRKSPFVKLINRANRMSKLGIWVDFERKIVCSELRRQDLISVSDWAYDASDCAQRFSPMSYQGYRLWAVPCLRMMRKHPMLSRLLASAVRGMVADIKYQRGVNIKPHIMGLVIRRGFFWPANLLMGGLVVFARAGMSTHKRSATSFVAGG